MSIGGRVRGAPALTPSANKKRGGGGGAFPGVPENTWTESFSGGSSSTFGSDLTWTMGWLANPYSGLGSTLGAVGTSGGTATTTSYVVTGSLRNSADGGVTTEQVRDYGGAYTAGFPFGMFAEVTVAVNDVDPTHSGYARVYLGAGNYSPYGPAVMTVDFTDVIDYILVPGDLLRIEVRPDGSSRGTAAGVVLQSQAPGTYNPTAGLGQQGWLMIEMITDTSVDPSGVIALDTFTIGPL